MNYIVKQFNPLKYNIPDEVATGYYNSLVAHIWNVQIAGKIIGVDESRLYSHDASKFSDYEFPFYAVNFYGDELSKAGNKKEFDKAVSHHIIMNDHHWLYWVNKGKVYPMPESAVLEMVADWHGSGKSYQGKWDISGWYNDKFFGMNLHTDTIHLTHMTLQRIGYFVGQDGMIEVTPRFCENFLEFNAVCDATKGT